MNIRNAFIILSLAIVLLPVSNAVAVSEVGPLPNFHTVDPGIYRGAAPTLEGLRRLKAMGVKTIIDLRGPGQANRERPIAEGLGFKWMNLPMGAEPPTSKEVGTLLSTLKHASPQAPVFVHCQHGADRTGCMIGIWRVNHDAWTFDQAYAEMRKYGFKKAYTRLAGTVRKYAVKTSH